MSLKERFSLRSSNAAPAPAGQVENLDNYFCLRDFAGGQTIYHSKDVSFCQATSWIPDVRVFETREEAQEVADRLGVRHYRWTVCNAWWAKDPARYGIKMDPVTFPARAI